MSKPEDIPQDIWDAAAIGAAPLVKRQELIARAVMAEREACAHAAFDAAKAARCGVLRARQIDAAIRNRGEVNTAHTFKNRED
ncbi:hypothetical protein [Devosia sp.]|uniref:hypothetical protein n=1 Tax=Devosia sp. TaxID=1871048 RepID=UPI002AFECD68|nr:hypothetical protein [Devosia sp.]